MKCDYWRCAENTRNWSFRMEFLTFSILFQVQRSQFDEVRNPHMLLVATLFVSCHGNQICLFTSFIVVFEFSQMSSANTHLSAKNPLILDGNQWQDIIKQLQPEAEALARREKDREYEEYLKNGSRSMTKHWTNSVEKIRERKNIELMQAKERKRAEGK